VKHALVVAVTSILVSTGIASAQTTPSGGAASGPLSLGAEALLWWFKDSPAPTPLVTDGLVGAPGTRVFLGGEDLDANPNAGFRLSAGYALTERWGLESNVFYVPSSSTSRSVSASGQPGTTGLRIPFFDVTLPGESTTGLASPGRFAGSATEELRNSLLGSELNVALRAPMGGPWRMDLLGGFRYLRLRESYAFSTDSPSITPPIDVFQTKDEFDATNNFFGAQLGARARGDWGSWFASGVVKVGLGAMVQSVDIDGRVVTNDFNSVAGVGPTQTYAGGYFAQPTNMGHHTRSRFAVVPEAGLTVGYRLTPWMAIVAGYTFLYVNDVARAPQQVNRSINPTGRPGFGDNPSTTPFTGPAEPSFRVKSSDFWAQGLNVGLALRF
jgi:hypothetical protein